jgi:hypothetical protein
MRKQKQTNQRNKTKIAYQQEAVAAEQLKKTQEPNERNRQNQKTIFTRKMRQEN